MKEIILSIYGWIILADVTLSQKAIVAIVSVVVILGVAPYFIIKWRTKRATNELARISDRSPDLVLDETSKRKSKKEFKLTGFHVDPFDKNHFISDVYERLKVRESPHKNLDMMAFSSSWPHCFSDQQLDEIKKMILEITKLTLDSHEIIVTKSPAACFSDFSDKLKEFMFAQLHSVYANRFFRQSIKLSLYENKNGVNLHFLSFKYVDIKFTDLLRKKSTIQTVFLKDSPSNATPIVAVLKHSSASWLNFKNDVLAVFNDYYYAGVDFEGEWPRDDSKEKEIKKESENLDEISLGFSISNEGNLVFFLPLRIDPIPLKSSLENVPGISAVRVWNEFNDIRFTLCKHEDANWSEFATDILSAFALSYNGLQFVMYGKWPV